jgi:uncharacterized protein YkwD
LAKAANVHALNMARMNKSLGDAGAMQHTLLGTTTPTPSDRLDLAGYNWTSYGENIAFGYPTAAAVVAGWMSSPNHRANILSRNVTQIGVSVAADANGDLYWCQDFGRSA